MKLMGVRQKLKNIINTKILDKSGLRNPPSVISNITSTKQFKSLLTCTPQIGDSNLTNNNKSRVMISQFSNFPAKKKSFRPNITDFVLKHKKDFGLDKWLTLKKRLQKEKIKSRQRAKLIREASGILWSEASSDDDRTLVLKNKARGETPEIQFKKTKDLIMTNMEKLESSFKPETVEFKEKQ
jgi:hypothetical protein